MVFRDHPHDSKCFHTVLNMQENQRLVAHHRTQPLQYSVLNLHHGTRPLQYDLCHRTQPLQYDLYHRTQPLQYTILLNLHHRAQPLRYDPYHRTRPLWYTVLNLHPLAAIAISACTRNGKLLWLAINKAAFSTSVAQGHYSLYTG